MVKSTASIPGATPGSAETCAERDGHCITCGDEGITMRVLEHHGDLAVCSDPEHDRHEVAIDLVGPVRAGDEILVHAGVAIRHLGVAA